MKDGLLIRSLGEKGGMICSMHCPGFGNTPVTDSKPTPNTFPLLCMSWCFVLASPPACRVGTLSAVRQPQICFSSGALYQNIACGGLAGDTGTPEQRWGPMGSSCVHAAAFRLHLGGRDVGLMRGRHMSAWGRPVGCLGNGQRGKTQCIQQSACCETMREYPRLLAHTPGGACPQQSSWLVPSCLASVESTFCCPMLICSAGLHIGPRHAPGCVASLHCVYKPFLRPEFASSLCSHRHVGICHFCCCSLGACAGTRNNPAQHRSRP